MAVQFHCGSCGRPIETDDAYAGQQVNCPICGQATVAPAMSKGPGGAMPPPPGYSPGYSPHFMPKNGKATASFVLGICGFFVGWPITPILAIVFGKMALKEMLGRGNPDSVREANRGVKMGIISLCVLGALMVIYIIVIIGFVSSSSMSSSYSY